MGRLSDLITGSLVCSLENQGFRTGTDWIKRNAIGRQREGYDFSGSLSGTLLSGAIDGDVKGSPRS